MLGLRVENRTAVDLIRVLVEIVETIAADHPDAVFVVDGHNSRPGSNGAAVIEGHTETAATQSPIEVERSLAWALRAWFADRPLRIVDTLGAPLEDSLAWADRADCFVAIWGAGLAKYRWVCNKPGLIVTGRWNRLERVDLRIYDQPDYMESPTPVVFAPPTLVEDRPESPLLVDYRAMADQDPRSYCNFKLDHAAFRPLLRNFIAAVQAGPAALASLAQSTNAIAQNGSIDVLGPVIAGWAIAAGGQPCHLTAVLDGHSRTTIPCNIDRPDVRAAGFATASAGFSFALPDSLRDGAPHDLAILFPDGTPLPFNPATGLTGPVWRFQLSSAA